jgi:hypothetical protein
MNAEVQNTILFAGYSATGEVPLIDLLFLKELKRHGDLFVMYDNDYLAPRAIEAIESIGANLKYERHSEYDFGSWKRLLRNLPTKDDKSSGKIVLVNDSCIILQPLDDFFFNHPQYRDSDFFCPGIVDEDYVGSDIFVEDYMKTYDFFSRSAMFVSYFWSLDSKLAESYLFKHFVSSIRPLPTRIEVSYLFERGFSRTILRHGVRVATAIDRVFPQSWPYKEQAFLMAAAGFPLIKKKALSPEFYPIGFINQRISMLVDLADPTLKAGILDYLGLAKI